MSIRGYYSDIKRGARSLAGVSGDSVDPAASGMTCMTFGFNSDG